METTIMGYIGFRIRGLYWDSIRDVSRHPNSPR